MKHAETTPARASTAAPAADALIRAQQLVDSPLTDAYDAGWVHLAHHVGDLSVLAVTLSR